MNIYRILSLTLSVVILFSLSATTAEAKPITEPTQQNKQELLNYYNQYINLLKPTFDIYQDIDIYSDYFIILELLKKDGVLTPDNNFYPQSNLSTFDFLELYFLTFYKNKIEKLSFHYYESSIDEKKEILNKLQKQVQSKSPIWRQLDNPTISEDLARKFMGLPSSKSKEKLINRLDGIDLIIEKMKQKKIYDEWRNQIIDSKYKKIPSYPLPEISMEDGYIKIDEEPLKGLFVNWMSDLSVLSSREIDKEIKRMKSYGIRGVSLELRWDKLEPNPDQFIFPQYFDHVLRKLAREGMYVHLLLSAHYTPDWVFHKYNQDIRMYDINGIPQDEGEYAMYSYLSPGVDDQIKFQEKAIEYYEKFPNIITFLLGNEQSYGKENDVDYSFWMQDEWKSWLKTHNLPNIEIPRDYNNTDDRKKWLRFRQDVLNEYYKKVYRELKQVQSRIPISFKFIPYENTSAYAPDYGLNLSPLDLDMDFLATDIYGYTPNVYSQQYAFDKTKVILETNLPGDWEDHHMFNYLLINYFHRIPLQSIFAWVNGEFENALLHDNGNPWDKMNSLKHVSEVIDLLDMPNLKSDEIAIVIPRNGINLEAKQFTKYQYKIDDLIDYIFSNTGKYPMTIWSDEFQPDDLSGFSKSWNKDELSKFKEIIIIESPYDLNHIGVKLPDTEIYTSPEEYINDKS